MQAIARTLAENVKTNLAQHNWMLGDKLLPALLSVQPVATLDVLLGDPQVPLSHLAGNREWIDGHDWPTWLDGVPDGVLLTWVRDAPAFRAHRIAALCRFERNSQSTSGEPAQPAWTALAQELINACPDRLSVLKQFADRLVPVRWRGSRAAIVERRRLLFAPYLTDAEASVAAWARGFDAKAGEIVERLRLMERQQDRQSQTFE